MKNFWLADNEDMAQKDTLIRLTGMLGVKKESGIPVTAEEILEYIENTVQELEAKYNEKYPGKARIRITE